MKAEDLKLIVKEKYGEIASHSKSNDGSSCCGSSGCCYGTEYSDLSDSYENIAGYDPDADLGLGCGIPTKFAKIKEGDTVVDLGSGAGNDAIVARTLTGESGKVIGVDFTEAMIYQARNNIKKLGFTNVGFVLSDIEDINLPLNTADVVISNCVLNLVPDKKRAFGEVFRILKPGGHLSVSDIVTRGELPKGIKEASEMYAGCVSGAIYIDDYLAIMSKAGLVNIVVQKEKRIDIPDETLLNYCSSTEMKEIKKSESGIFSITVYAEKPFVASSI